MSVLRSAFVPVFALLLAACGGGGGEVGGEVPVPGGDPLEAPAIASTVPAQDAVEVSVATPVQIRFAVPIDASSVRPDLMRVDTPFATVPGSARYVAPDRVEFTPDADLALGVPYVVTLAPGVRDLEGNVRNGAYAFGFETESPTPQLAFLHEQESADMRVHALALNDSGDGMSLMYRGGSQARGPMFRRIRDGIPTGPVQPIALDQGTAYIPVRAFDVAPNGDVQYVWMDTPSGRRSAYVRQYDHTIDAWTDTVELTPGPDLEARSVDGELGAQIGLVLWVERELGAVDEQVRVAHHDAATGLRDERGLGPVVGRKGTLHLAHGGPHAVAAFTSRIDDRSEPYAARLHDTLGFDDALPLDPGHAGGIRAVAASATGHLFVLFVRLDPADPSRAQPRLAIARPGEPFAPSVALNEGYATIGACSLAVGENGIATVAYAVFAGPSATYVRRYRPGVGLGDAVEMTGLAWGVGGASALALDVDAGGNAAVAAAVATTSGGQQICAALLPVDSPWRTAIPITSELRRPTTPQIHVALTPGGGAHVGWVTQKDDPAVLAYLARLLHVAFDGTTSDISTYGEGQDRVIANLRLGLCPDGRGLVLYDRLTGDGSPQDDVYQASIR